jgi:hypothetical protein
MGFLDCLAGFLSATGAFYTPGGVQQLLNQSLIPLTMLASWVFLDKSPTIKQMTGAAVIFIGVLVVMLPTITSQSLNSPLSSIIYFSSNIPSALSFCYKEYGFKNLSIHVILLTQLVSIYQFLIGFALAPIMAKMNGINLNQIIDSFNSGLHCFIGISGKEECRSMKAFFYLTGYCLVNFIFNTLGLYLVKHGSATLNSISYAIILPITTLAFTVPMMGPYREHFNINTLDGLVVVLIGFAIWTSESNSGEISQPPSLLHLENTSIITKRKLELGVTSFNERTIVPIMIPQKKIRK